MLPTPERGLRRFHLSANPESEVTPMSEPAAFAAAQPNSSLNAPTMAIPRCEAGATDSLDPVSFGR